MHSPTLFGVSSQPIIIVHIASIPGRREGVCGPGIEAIVANVFLSGCSTVSAWNGGRLGLWRPADYLAMDTTMQLSCSRQRWIFLFSIFGFFTVLMFIKVGESTHALNTIAPHSYRTSRLASQHFSHGKETSQTPCRDSCNVCHDIVVLVKLARESTGQVDHAVCGMADRVSP